MNQVLACPIDQLHLSGRLVNESDNSDIRQNISDLRYIAAKRLKTCDVSEFDSVSHRFRLQKDLVYRVIRSGSRLPPSANIWLPALHDALDAAILYWDMTNNEEDDNRGDVPNGDRARLEPKCVILEPHSVYPRGPVYANP
jgi:hypothetical protein